MFLWCAYCYKYLGEKEPLDNLSISHGICNQCLHNLDLDDNQANNFRWLKSFARNLHESTTRADYDAIYKLLEDGKDHSIRPIDILLGLIQPWLYEIGELWAKNAITVAEEHKFTAVCNAIIDLIYAFYGDFDPHRQSPNPDILLVAVEGNHHIIGLKILEFVLVSNGINCFTLTNDISAQSILDLCKRFEPRYLGISISFHWHYAQVKEVCQLLHSIPKQPEKIFVGGLGTKHNPEQTPGMAYETIRDINYLVEIIKKGLDDRNMVKPGLTLFV